MKALCQAVILLALPLIRTGILRELTTPQHLQDEASTATATDLAKIYVFSKVQNTFLHEAIPVNRLDSSTTNGSVKFGGRVITERFITTAARTTTSSIFTHTTTENIFL
jgi:hypothetical protein